MWYQTYLESNPSSAIYEIVTLDESFNLCEPFSVIWVDKSILRIKTENEGEALSRVPDTFSVLIPTGSTMIKKNAQLEGVRINHFIS